MEKQNRLCGQATSKRSVIPIIPFLALAAGLSASTWAAESEALVDELKRKLAQREAEIAALKQQIARLEKSSAGASESLPSRSAPRPAGKPADEEEDELTRALESSLVRQGGSVLGPGTMELEPELNYFYSEPDRSRRDNAGLALVGRLGLPGAMQAELRLPYIVRDHWSGLGTSSGLGDVRLGLTKELLPGGERAPSLLAFIQWRAATGDVNARPPTGYGQHALQFGMSTVRRQDPVVLFGSLSYTVNRGSAHLDNGLRYSAGDVFGGRLGAYLAATPDTSVYAGVSFNSNRADRFNGGRIEGSSRLSSMVELGTTTVIGRGRFLNISAGFGVTPAAPKFSLAVSLPFRF